MTDRFVRQIELPVPADAAFDWHERPGALERLTPPWESVAVLERSGGIRDGARVVLRTGRGPLAARWDIEHRDYVPGRQFRDVLRAGPFPRWEHTHRFTPASDDRSILEDLIDYELPLGPLGRLAAGYVRARLKRLFRYRHDTTAADLAFHRTWADHPRLTVAVTGASGLIGRTLCAMLSTGGHRVIRLVRSAPRGPDEAAWDPARGLTDPAALVGIDAVVHLAGENIASGRWTADRLDRIRRSRVDGTRALLTALRALPQPPRAVLCASAIGFYGARGDEELAEHSPRGTGVLADICEAWESAAVAAVPPAARLVLLRFGVVLSPAGGMLTSLLPVFRLGLGGRVGTGRQYLSWVSIDDAAGAAIHALHTERLRGPVNVVAPAPVTNAELAGTLGRVLRRPAVLPAPAAALRLAVGRMADELILASVRARPAALEQTGYRFRHPRLEDALRHVLGRWPAQPEAAG